MSSQRRLGLLLATIIVGGAIYLGLRGYLRHRVDRELDATARAIPEIVAIDYARMDLHLYPLGIELQQVRLVPRHGAPIPIGRIHLKRFTAGQVLPDQLALSLYAARIPRSHPAAAQMAHLLRRLDIPALDIDLHVQLARDPTRNESWCGHLELHVRQAGILRMALAVENLDVKGVLGALDNPLNWVAVLPPLGIRAAALEFEEGGLVKRMVADHARRTGNPPAVARQQIAAQIARAARKQQISPLGERMAAFVAAPIRIGYHTGNPEPIYLGRLLWSRKVRDWLVPLRVSGYLAEKPRDSPWTTAAIVIPGRPPRL